MYLLLSKNPQLISKSNKENIIYLVRRYTLKNSFNIKEDLNLR